jgi:hypothetical protein
MLGRGRPDCARWDGADQTAHAGPGPTRLRSLQLKEEQLWGAEVELDQLLAATALTEEQVRAAYIYMCAQRVYIYMHIYM